LLFSPHNYNYRESRLKMTNVKLQMPNGGCASRSH
jgi:hypothetical protein